MLKKRVRNGQPPSGARGFPLKTIIIPVIILLVLCLALGYIWKVLSSSDYFKVTEVIQKEAKDADLSYLKGRNIFSVDLKKEAAGILGAFPACSEVRLVRLLPNKIYVHFVKRKPVALIRSYRYFALDREGVIFYAPPGQEGLILPMITGLEAKGLKLKPGSRYTCREVLLALAIIRESERNRALKDYRIKRIDVANALNAYILVQLPQPQMPGSVESRGVVPENLEIRLGPDNIKAKFIFLGNWLTCSKSELSNIKYIDLRFKEPVIKLKNVK